MALGPVYDTLAMVDVYSLRGSLATACWVCKQMVDIGIVTCLRSDIFAGPTTPRVQHQHSGPHEEVESMIAFVGNTGH